MTDPLIIAENITFAYPHTQWRLNDISFCAQAGQIVGIIGPNGAGKSTLLKITAGLFAPTTGRILLKGRDLAGLPRRRIAAQLGYLPQNVISTFDYSVEDVVAMGCFCRLQGLGFLSKDDRIHIDYCLDITETTPFRHRPISQLSGGERQRALLASVLAQKPQILLLDEPTTGLDLHHQTAFFDLLAQLAGQGLAVITITHDLNLAALYCHKLLLLSQGRLVREGSVDDVIQNDILSDIYRQNILVSRHPNIDRPVVLPLPAETTNNFKKNCAAP